MNFDQIGNPKICAVVRGKSPATSLSYHEDGKHLYVASEQDSRLRLVDTLRGVSDRPCFKFEREGIRVARATHHEDCILYTAGKGDSNQTSTSTTQKHAIKYTSLFDNKTLRNFHGHSNTITDISLSPLDDTFLSSSADKTVRLWNIQQSSPLAQMELPKSGVGADGSTYYMDSSEGAACAAFDSTGLVYGITAPLANKGGHLIHLYDARNYNGGAFAEMKVETSSILKTIQNLNISSPTIASELSQVPWTSMRFNQSGKSILIQTNYGITLAIDGYNGAVTHAFVSEEIRAGAVESASETLPMNACYSSDNKTVLGANEDGTINCWNAETGLRVQKLQGHVGRVGCIAVNPKYAQIATACTNTAIWLW